MKIKDLLLENRRSIIRELADTIGISRGSVNTVLKDTLGLERAKSRFTKKNGGSKLEVQNLENQTDPLDYQIVLP